MKTSEWTIVVYIHLSTCLSLPMRGLGLVPENLGIPCSLLFSIPTLQLNDSTPTRRLQRAGDETKTP